MTTTIKETTPPNDTPMLRQYKAIKKDHQDAILFFRLGDFYEMFLDDAKVAARELELTLTGRGKDENRIPMCGIPYHAADNYIPRLVNKGYKVAICEQTEEATAGKGITKREVVKIITPGTILGDGQLDEQENNFLLAITSLPKTDTHFGISLMDISTGEFRLGLVSSPSELNTWISRLAPKEMIIPIDFDQDIFTSTTEDILLNTVHMLDADRADHHIKSHFNIQSLAAFGIEDHKAAFPAAWALLDYTIKTQKNTVPHITQLTGINTQHLLSLDRATLKNLELTTSLHHKGKQGTLFWVLNHHKTAMGSRKLKSMLLAPSSHPEQINRRLDAVAYLKNDLLSREEIRESLNHVYDLERLISRIASAKQNPRDLLALKSSLESLNELKNTLNQFDNPGILLQHLSNFFETYTQETSPYQAIITLIATSIEEDAPPSLKDGNVIKPSYHNKLKELLESFQSVKEWIANLDQEEREKTGIKSLKVGFNKVFGYYLEAPKSQQDNVPKHYIRKQTLTNAERYITPELKEKESVLLTGEEKKRNLELELYQEIVETITPHIPDLQKLAERIAHLDVLQSLATAAQKYNYTRPTISNSDTLDLHLEESRHPVLERQSDTPFIPNTIHMSNSQNRFMLITGPNMAGKSTLMRQVALNVIMAQIGSFVPAKSATISTVDQLFTRIGALDNLYAGQSTFMVEMLEAATILRNASSKSLIILDEVGRGTATFDGMSIACAITEHIHENIKARTLFATHYHELTTLAKRYSELSNFRLEISEIDGKLIFTHLFKEGPADKSYGIHVGQMAGLPESVIQNAEKHLAGFETQGADYLKSTTAH